MPNYKSRPILAGEREHIGWQDLPERGFTKVTYDVGHEVEDNLARAHSAAVAVRKFAETQYGSNEDVTTAIGDLMGNLFHLVDALNASGMEWPTDLDALLERGRVHYRAEISGEL